MSASATQVGHDLNHKMFFFRAVSFPRPLYVAQTSRSDARGSGTQIF